MPPQAIDAEHWRELARQARIQAEQFTEGRKRRIMLRIADDYERLAKQAEREIEEPSSPIL